MEGGRATGTCMATTKCGCLLNRKAEGGGSVIGSRWEAGLHLASHKIGARHNCREIAAHRATTARCEGPPLARRNSPHSCSCRRAPRTRTQVGRRKEVHHGIRTVSRSVGVGVAGGDERRAGGWTVLPDTVVAGGCCCMYDRRGSAHSFSLLLLLLRCGSGLERIVPERRSKAHTVGVWIGIAL
jgi:hypothetical protein